MIRIDSGDVLVRLLTKDAGFVMTAFGRVHCELRGEHCYRTRDNSSNNHSLDTNLPWNVHSCSIRATNMQHVPKKHNTAAQRTARICMCANHSLPLQTRDTMASVFAAIQTHTFICCRQIFPGTVREYSQYARRPYHGHSTLEAAAATASLNLDQHKQTKTQRKYALLTLLEGRSGVASSSFRDSYDSLCIPGMWSCPQSYVVFRAVALVFVGLHSVQGRFLLLHPKFAEHK